MSKVKIIKNKDLLHLESEINQYLSISDKDNNLIDVKIIESDEPISTSVSNGPKRRIYVALIALKS